MVDHQRGPRREVVCRPRGFEDIVPGTGGCTRLGSFPSFHSRNTNLPLSSGRCGSWVGVPLALRLMFFFLQEQEWWDNNSGANYRIGFTKRVVKDQLKEEERNGIYDGVNVDITNKNHLFSQIFPLKTIPAPPRIFALQSQKKREAQAY